MSKDSLKRPINNYKEFMNFKFDLNDFDKDYIKYGGNCACNRYLKGGNGSSVVDMDTFLKSYLPSLKGGYLKRKNNRKVNKRQIKKGGYVETYDGADIKDFNLFRDTLTVNGNGFNPNTNILSDLTTKVFNYPSAEQNVSRSLF